MIQTVFQRQGMIQFFTENKKVDKMDLKMNFLTITDGSLKYSKEQEISFHIFNAVVHPILLIVFFNSLQLIWNQRKVYH